MAKKTKYRNPHQGYSRVATRAHTSQALDATFELDGEIPLDKLAPDSIARLMLGAEPSPVAPAPVAATSTVETDAPESGRMVELHGAVTHVVRAEGPASVTATSGRQRAIDRLLEMVRKRR